MYEDAATEHFNQYRAGTRMSPSSYTDAQLAKFCAVPLKRFKREQYLEAWNNVSAAKRWETIVRSHRTHK